MKSWAEGLGTRIQKIFFSQAAIHLRQTVYDSHSILLTYVSQCQSSCCAELPGTPIHNYLTPFYFWRHSSEKVTRLCLLLQVLVFMCKRGWGVKQCPQCIHNSTRLITSPTQCSAKVITTRKIVISVKGKWI